MVIHSANWLKNLQQIVSEPYYMHTVKVRSGLEVHLKTSLLAHSSQFNWVLFDLLERPPTLAFLGHQRTQSLSGSQSPWSRFNPISLSSGSHREVCSRTFPMHIIWFCYQFSTEGHFFAASDSLYAAYFCHECASIIENHH